MAALRSRRIHAKPWQRGGPSEYAKGDEQLDRATLARGPFPAGRPKGYRGRTYPFDGETWSDTRALPGDRAFVVGAEDSLVWRIGRLERGDAPGLLSPARAEPARHTLFAAVRPSLIVPPAGLPAELRPLAEAHPISLAIDPGKTLQVGLSHQYADATGGAGPLRHGAETSLQDMVFDFPLVAQDKMTRRCERVKIPTTAAQRGKSPTVWTGSD